MGIETSDEFYRVEYRSEDDPHSGSPVSSAGASSTPIAEIMRR